MTDTIQTRAERPFYLEARKYCDVCGIEDEEAVERYRLTLCVMEHRRQMQPFIDALVRIRVTMLPGDDPPAGYLAIEEAMREHSAFVAAKLKIPAATQGAPE